MAHQHSVYDTDLHFKIDPVTREIKKNAVKAVIIQGDHNSERFTFEIPRFVEEHDMTLCTDIKIHFLNVSADKSQQRADIYPVTDMTLSPESDDIVIFSWLLSRNAAAYAGTLNFAISFECNVDGVNEYTWKTSVNSNVIVSQGINNTDIIIEEYSDLLEAWEWRLFSESNDGVTNIEEAKTRALSDISAHSKDFSNALKASAVGEMVAIKDISPIEHELNVKVRRKNLIPYPFYNGTQTIEGVSFIDNGDGTITANGTATADARFYVLPSDYKVVLTPGTYTFSGCPKGASNSTFYFNTTFGKVMGDGLTVTVDTETTVALNIVFVKGVTLDNVIFSPQIEKGANATSYTPYVKDIDAVKVLAQGANLIPYPYDTESKTINGVAFTVNMDGTVTANGTATARVDFLLSDYRMLLKAGVSYTLSGCPSGGAYNTYMLRFSGSPTGVWADYGEGKTFKPSVDTTDYLFAIRIEEGIKVDNLVFRPQLECGEITKYEPSKEPIEYSQSDTIKTIYPCTTLRTDTAGAVVECEYNRDINKAFAEIYSALASATASASGSVIV